MYSVVSKIPFLFLAAFTAVSVVASDIPVEVFGTYVKKQPSCFWHMNREICNDFHWDTVEIKRNDVASAYVSIEIEKTNGHGCAFRGVGRWVENSLLVVGKPSEYKPKPEGLDRESTPQEWGVCRVVIRRLGDAVTYDVDMSTANFCHSAYCSALGWLHFMDERARPIYERKN